MKNWGKRGIEETAGAKASGGSEPGVSQESKAADVASDGDSRGRRSGKWPDHRAMWAQGVNCIVGVTGGRERTRAWCDVARWLGKELTVTPKQGPPELWIMKALADLGRTRAPLQMHLSLRGPAARSLSRLCSQKHLCSPLGKCRFLFCSSETSLFVTQQLSDL